MRLEKIAEETVLTPQNFSSCFVGDAYHITAPSEGGYGAYLAMRNALRDAGLKPQDVHYINAHATSTLLGKAVFDRLLFGKIESGVLYAF